MNIWLFHLAKFVKIKQLYLKAVLCEKQKKSTTVSKKHQEFVHESSILEEYSQHRRFYQVLRLSCRCQASLARPLLQHQIEKHKWFTQSWYSTCWSTRLKISTRCCRVSVTTDFLRFSDISDVNNSSKVLKITRAVTTSQKSKGKLESAQQNRECDLGEELHKSKQRASQQVIFSWASVLAL